MSEDLNSVFPQPSNVTVKGESYEMHPISPGDIAKASRFITDQRLEHFLQRTRNHPLSDTARAKCMAEIETTSVGLQEVFGSFVGQLYLVWLSLCKGPKPPTSNYNDFERLVEDIELTDLTTRLMVISKLLDPKAMEAEGEGSDPTTTTDHPRTFAGAN